MPSKALSLLSVISFRPVSKDMCGRDRLPYWDIHGSRKKYSTFLPKSFWLSLSPSSFPPDYQSPTSSLPSRTPRLLTLKTSTSFVNSLIYGSQVYLASSLAQMNALTRVVLSSQAAEQCWTSRTVQRGASPKSWFLAGVSELLYSSFIVPSHFPFLSPIFHLSL